MGKLSDKEINDLLDDLLVDIYGIKYFIPRKEHYYTKYDLDAIRSYKGYTESIEQIFGAVDDKAAKELSEDDNATVSWFDETIPEASDVTNLMMAEAVCANAIDEYNDYKNLNDYKKSN